MRKRTVIIIGGGASGMTAAISAAREGAEVILIEHKERLGKKILSTGNGRCNVTNECMTTACFRSDDSAIVGEVLEQFGAEKTMQFFEELGVILKSRQGYIYPVSDQASAILEVLEMELQRLSVTICLEHRILEVKKKPQGYLVNTDKGTYKGDALILATGGKAAPVLGSDGSGYAYAKQFGHHLSPVVPALVQLRGSGVSFKQVAGVRTHAKVSLFVDDTVVGSDTGEVQMTNYGISGIPVFQVSRYAAKGLYEKRKVLAELDFFPELSEEDFQAFVTERLEKHGYKTAEAFFVGMLPKKLIGFLLKEARIPLHVRMDSVYDEKVKTLLSLCKHFPIVIEGTNDFEQAQVCAGGVKTTEVHPKTLESVYVSDLYLVGELLDVDGICGGYNLQWAWATGFLAGKAAAKGADL